MSKIEPVHSCSSADPTSCIRSHYYYYCCTMSDQWYEQQHKQRQGQGGGTGARREALAGVGPERGAPDNNDQGGEGGEGGAVSNQDGEWVEGSGWRMKAPEEKKRQQVLV